MSVVLASGADLWYQGSGATAATGASSGFRDAPPAAHVAWAQCWKAGRRAAPEILVGERIRRDNMGGGGRGSFQRHAPSFWSLENVIRF